MASPVPTSADSFPLPCDVSARGLVWVGPAWRTECKVRHATKLALFGTLPSSSWPERQAGRRSTAFSRPGQPPHKIAKYLLRCSTPASAGKHTAHGIARLSGRLSTDRAPASAAHSYSSGRGGSWGKNGRRETPRCLRCQRPSTALPGPMPSPMRAATDPRGLRIGSCGSNSGLRAFPLAPLPRRRPPAGMVWVSALSRLR